MASRNDNFARTVSHGFFSASPTKEWLKKPYIGGPNLHATLDPHPNRIPPINKAKAKRSLAQELQWNHRFAVTFSKDNRNYPSGLREYFTHPRKFDTETEDVFRKSLTCMKTTMERCGIQQSLSQKRSKAFAPLKRGELSKEKNWMNVYSPISENNVIKHACQRNYFMPARYK